MALNGGLTGNEVLYVQGQTPNGTPCAILEQTTTANIAALNLPAIAYVTTTQNSVSTTTLANVSGLSLPVVGGGTYNFYCYLPGTSGASGGIKLAFNYTTATISTISAIGLAFTAAAVAVAYTSTTSTQTALVSNSAANIYSELKGEFTVGASSGTVQLQFAQAASSASTTSIYAGAYMQLTRTS